MSWSEVRRVATMVRLITEKSDGAPRPHIDLEDVESGTGRLLPSAYEIEEQQGAVRHQPGDVLFSKLRPYLAKSVRASKDGTATGEMLTLRPQEGLDSRYLHYLTLSQPWIEWAVATSYGSKMPRSSWEQIRQLQVCVPLSEMQRRIVDYLDAKARALAKAQSRIARALAADEEHFRSTLWSEVTGRTQGDLTPSGLAWAPAVPANWRIAKITHFAKLGTGHTPSRSHAEWWVDTTIPWVTTGEVHQFRDDQVEVITETREKISRLGLENSAAVLHPAGTVVLSRTASAGFSAIMGRDMATSQDYVTWTCGPELEPAYLLWCLRAMRPYLLGNLAQGSTHKTIYFPDIQAMKIPIPPVAEQRLIVDRIREAREHSLQMQTAYRRLDQLLVERQSALITAAVTGQFDVTTARKAA